mmetsp:Transcript_26467/g.47777  ORF Transcript_26467/g.47777 Transcript_26467/m.47777 type:complete len:225 (+) Transcript_26467:39-713(+)
MLSPAFLASRQPAPPAQAVLQRSTRLPDEHREHKEHKAVAVVAIAAAVATQGRGSQRRPLGRRASVQCKAAATNFSEVIKQRSGTGLLEKDEVKEESKTSRDFWAIMAHAPIVNCSCNSILSRIPGIKRWTCTCPGSKGSKQIKTKDGRCALTVPEYAEVLCQGVPLLSRAKAYKIAASLFESALANPVGTVMVIGTFKKVAQEYEQKLTNLGLWVSIVPVDKD